MTINDKIVALYKYCDSTNCDECKISYYEKTEGTSYHHRWSEDSINHAFHDAFEHDTSEWQKEEPEPESVPDDDDFFDTVISIKSSRIIASIDICFETEGGNVEIC